MSTHDQVPRTGEVAHTPTDRVAILEARISEMDRLHRECMEASCTCYSDPDGSCVHCARSTRLSERAAKTQEESDNSHAALVEASEKMARAADDMEQAANQLACARDKQERNKWCVRLATEQYNYKQARDAFRAALQLAKEGQR